MCGIFGFFTVGDFDSYEVYALDNDLLNDIGVITQERGRDGYGVMINGDYFIKRPNNERFNIDFPIDKLEFGIMNCRAKPETEIESSYTNVQPIRNHNSYLVHNGALSEQYNKMIFERYNYDPQSKIDSEGLLCLLHNVDEVTSKDLSEIDGGFAYIYMKPFGLNNLKVSIGVKYQPLHQLKVTVFHKDEKKEFYYYHTMESALDLIIDWFKEKNIKNIVFDKREFKPYSYMNCVIRSLVLLSYNEGTFQPKFQYPNRAKSNGMIKVLCAASSGIDSTTSLMLADKLLKDCNLDYSIDAVHFKYGHRGQDAEEFAIKKIIKYSNSTKDTNFNLKICNLEDVYKYILNVKNSQLIDINSTIETGTQDMLKSTIAWVPVRNMLMQTILTGLAETYILEEGYDKVYLIAGWNQLSEEGFYPDNSVRFSKCMSDAAKFGTLVGHKIHSWNLCSNLLKSDQWLLASVYDFLDVFKYTISCDIPIIKRDSNNEITNVYNCAGQCGSTLLSKWAAERYKDIKDPRKFKEANVNVRKEDLYHIPNQEVLNITSEIIKDVESRIILIDEIIYV